MKGKERAPQEEIVDRMNLQTTECAERKQDNEKEDNLDLNPDFQRGHVWNYDQRVRYLEFIFQGGILVWPILLCSVISATINKITFLLT